MKISVGTILKTQEIDDADLVRIMDDDGKVLFCIDLFRKDPGTINIRGVETVHIDGKFYGPTFNIRPIVANSIDITLTKR